MLQRLRQCTAVRAELHRVGARLQHRDQARRADLAAQTIDGGFNRGGVVREVVIYRNAVDAAAHFHAPPHTLELLQRVGGGLRRDTRVTRSQHGRDRILRIVTAEHGPVHLDFLARAFHHHER
jgi:hypothetical protein